MRALKVITVFSAVLALTSLAKADIITIEITAVIDTINDPEGTVLGGQLNVGDLLTGSYTYNTLIHRIRTH